jgi:hypothetical protein
MGSRCAWYSPRAEVVVSPAKPNAASRKKSLRLFSLSQTIPSSGKLKIWDKSIAVVPGKGNSFF